MVSLTIGIATEVSFNEKKAISEFLLTKAIRVKIYG